MISMYLCMHIWLLVHLPPSRRKEERNKAKEGPQGGAGEKRTVNTFWVSASAPNSPEQRFSAVLPTTSQPP